MTERVVVILQRGEGRSIPDARVTKSMIGGFKMKMMKSLLLGSAAGLVAIAGAQASDLPVKAKPVCSLYGVGFYYIPGTDMCIKIGGWVRAEYAYGDTAASHGVGRTRTETIARPATARG